MPRGAIKWRSGSTGLRSRPFVAGRFAASRNWWRKSINMCALPTPTPSLSSGPPLRIRSLPKSSDYVNVFPGRHTSWSCLQGTQEFEERLLFGRFQLFEFLGGVRVLELKAQDGVEEGYGSAIVHETRMQADAPKRGGADLVGGVVVFGDGEVFPSDLVHLFAVVLEHGHDDAVAGANIMEQKVSVGMKLLITERRWDGESAAVDFCAGRSSRKCLDVANIAADF